jgi:hypothetical protein
MAVKDLKQDRSDKTRLVDRVLSDPDLYPDEFKAWLPRWLGGNVNFSLANSQLPAVETRKKVGDSGNAVFSGTWVNFGGTNESAQYMKDLMGFVHIGGVVKSGTIGTVIFTLPAGYRPEEAKIFAVASNGALGICTVNPDGTVVASSGSNVYFSLSGITFRAYS